MRYLWAFLLLAASCSEANPVASIEGPSFNTLNCTASPELCGRISSGISHLEGHSNFGCAYAGSMLRLLFEHPDYGFAAADPNIATVGMYVKMEQNVACPSGFCREDNNIYVASASRDDDLVGGLLAHEYEHYDGYDGPDHNVGSASSRQSICEL